MEYINQAIEINPDAHFGREIYQKYVVEYILEKRKDGELNFPLYEIPYNNPYYSEINFYEFLVKKSGKESLTKDEIKKAVKGVSGMMRFGNYDSPVLLEILGDLLYNNQMDDHKNISAKRFASMAYLKASLSFNDDFIKSKYNKLIEYVLISQEGLDRNGVKEMETLLKKELKKADYTSAQIQKNEILWAKSNKNLDIEFAKKYYTDAIEFNENENRKDKKIEEIDENHTTIYIISAIIVFAFIVFIFLRKRKKTP